MIHFVFLNTFRLPTIHTKSLAGLKSPPPLKPTVQMTIAKETPASAADAAGGRVELPVALVAFHEREEVCRRHLNPVSSVCLLLFVCGECFREDLTLPCKIFQSEGASIRLKGGFERSPIQNN